MPRARSTEYTPGKKPRAQHLALQLPALATIHDEATFTPAIRRRWAASSRRPKRITSLLGELGTLQAVEITGDLHVRGDFDVGAHGIGALWVHGNLVVDGVYQDPTDPQTVVLVGGGLRAHTIVTGAELEVRGKVSARHLAGDYNDHTATFHGDVEAVTFFPENHDFQLARPPRFDLVIGDDARDQVPRAIGKHLRILPNGALGGFLAKGLVETGDIDTDALYGRLRRGHDILVADPRRVSPELTVFSPSLRAQLATPTKVKRASLTSRDLTALPAPLLDCTNLTSLDLEDNRFVQVRGLDAFTRLATLDLSSNPIRVLPRELRGLVRLKSLSLRYTSKLEAFPAWFGELEQLESLDLTLSALKAFPRVLTALPALRRLCIWHLFDLAPDMLRDVVAAIGEMKLTQVSFLQGRLTALPDDLSPLGKVEVVRAIDLGLPAGEVARLAKAVPRLRTRWKDR